MDPIGEQADIRERTKAKCATAFALWAEGVDRLVRALDPLHGHAFQNPDVEHVQFALLGSAYNLQLGGLTLASGGLCGAALPMARRSFEDWLAWWYVRHCPEDAPKFLNLSERTPDRNHMIQQLENRFQRGREAEVRDWQKMLHELSHVDRISVRSMWLDRASPSDPSFLALGPTFDADLFNLTAAHFANVLPPLIEATDIMAQLHGKTPTDPGGCLNYRQRLDAWAQTL
jgi:hypothetical protein